MLSRRSFLRRAVMAPIAAAAAPLLGQPATRDYIRFKAAQNGDLIVGQILFTMNMVCVSPRTSRMLVGITA